ncbi:MAG: hypothetical protein KBC28_11335 [Alphaproteobacteria bacterium]|nr:hypothetical protein [Alphaproteobacteria bacterium]
MNRYLVFGYCQHYPYGAKGDVVGDFASFDEIKQVEDIYDYLKNEFLDILDMQEKRWLTDVEIKEGLRREK